MDNFWTSRRLSPKLGSFQPDHTAMVVFIASLILSIFSTRDIILWEARLGLDVWLLIKGHCVEYALHFIWGLLVFVIMGFYIAKIIESKK